MFNAFGVGSCEHAKHLPDRSTVANHDSSINLPERGPGRETGPQRRPAHNVCATCVKQRGRETAHNVLFHVNAPLCVASQRQVGVSPSYPGNKCRAMVSLHRLRVGQQDIGLLANRGILSKQMGAFAVRV